MIKAPFNFVPLNDKVFFPAWANEVSHDVPFEDTQSGIIDIEIKAESPIFIRDHEKQDQFCQHDGAYFIPGSSVKGMVRNVLEIMSFSKMSENTFNDDTYAVRDLRNRELYMSKMTPDKTMCGWLKKVENNYVIENCDIPGRIKHEEIDTIFGIDFASKFKSGKFKNKAKDKTAEIKYNLIGDKELTHTFTHVKTDVNREVFAYDANGKKSGTVVLTGQPSARNEPQGGKASGKIYEFVFFENKGDIVVEKRVMENFLFAYFDKRTTEPKESTDWTYWKRKLDEGGKVPVFFQKGGNGILHFGLSYLYKLPYSHSVKDGIPESHFDDRYDLSETIFGYVNKSKKEALKGRVQFSHFKAQGQVNVLNKRTEILGTPRASYYPMYVKQREGNLFTTFMNDGFSLAGRKRYPVHKGSGVEKSEETGNENVGTTFQPLQEGAVFKGKLRYHNLKKAELGALLSALTFHNTKDCCHNIGFAKPLGYGKVSLQLNEVEDLETYLKAFEVQVSEQIGSWSESEQLTELLTMATEQNNTANSALKYMSLKEFASNKTGDPDYLRAYTALSNIVSVKAESLISQEDLEALRIIQEEKRQEEERLQEERRKAAAHLQEWKIVEDSTTRITIESFIQNHPESEYLEAAKAKIAKIQEDEETAKKETAEKEAEDKWTNVLKNTKYLEQGLNDFIKNYPKSPRVKEAKVLLDEIKKPVTKVGLDGLSKARDGKKFKGVLDKYSKDNSFSPEDIELVKKEALTTYKKKSNNFFKDAQLGRFIGKDIENELKKEVGE